MYRCRRPAPQMKQNVRDSGIYTSFMPRSMAQEQDILKRPAPKRLPRLTSRRIGIHTSTAGGVQNAAERAYRLGCNTLQIFSSSPRQWAPYELGEPQCAEMNRLRAQYDLKPLVIHTNYLVNLASSNELFPPDVDARPFVAKSSARCLSAPTISYCIPDRFAAPTASRDCCAPPPRSPPRPKASISQKAD